MAHKAFDQLASDVAHAETLVVVGGSYAHYKHPEILYTVTGLVIFEADDEVAVRYYSALQPDIEFIRPLSSWLDVVDWQGKMVQRFTRKVNKPYIA